MKKTILQYQKAFNSVIEELKADENIQAAMVFGSMVSGDLWDESDIDFFVITNRPVENIQNIYMEENNISVHIKLMSKDEFKKFYERNLRGDFLHRIFASSRLVFSKNMEITSIYDGGRYYPDIDRKRWDMVYLGDLLKEIGVCKKYLYNNRIYTAYSAAVNCMEGFSKMFLNSSGYMISNDAMILTMNLNEEFKNEIKRLFFDKSNIEENIKKSIKYIEGYVQDNLKEITSILLEYMAHKNKALSSEEIKSDELFCRFSIAMEHILNKLSKTNIIKKDYREYKLSNGKILSKERVYYI